MPISLNAVLRNIHNTQPRPTQLRPAQPSPGQLRPALILLAASAAAPFFTGCGIISTPGTSANAIVNAAIAGRVHGGRQPVAGATITLYAPGTAGYGSAPTSIVTTTTDSAGNFTLPRPYTCPANSGNVYILATGGDPGAGTNAVLALAAELGPCSALSAATFLDITEATTIAAAYTLAPFAAISSGSTGIGTSSTNLLGLNNAYGPASNLVNLATGNARAASEITGLLLPTAEINTLANVLAACANTAGATGATDPCGKLFTAATPPSGSAPTDTFQAAIDIALNPGNNVTALYNLTAAVNPFQPALASAPADFAVAIDYTAGPIAASNGSAGIDIDAQGNAWLAVKARNLASASLAEIAPSGTLLSGTTGFLATGSLGIPEAVVVDGSGNVYTADAFYNQVLKVNSAGANPVALFPASLNAPFGLAFDNRDASLWVTNAGTDNNGTVNFSGTTLTHMSTAGADLTGSPFTGQDGPLSVAIDAAGSPWVANSDILNNGTGYLTKFTAGSGTYTGQNFAAGVFTFPFGVAIDNAANAWLVDTNGIAKFNSSGTQLSPSGGYALNLATSPLAMAIDGQGRAISSNAAVDSARHATNVPGSIAVFTNSGTLLSTTYSSTTSAGNFLGYSAVGAIPSYPFTPDGIKVDASGNVWVTGANPTGAQFVAQIIGIAAPVLTPLSTASSTAQLGTRP